MVSTSCPGCRVRERPGGTYLCYDCWGQLRLPVRRALGRPDMPAMRRLQDLFGQINAGIPLDDTNIVP